MFEFKQMKLLLSIPFFSYCYNLESRINLVSLYSELENSDIMLNSEVEYDEFDKAFTHNKYSQMECDEILFPLWFI